MDLIKNRKGYVKLKICGGEPERLLELFVNNRIRIWDIYAKGKYHYLNMYLKDFYQCRKLFKKAGVRAVVVERHGLPFLVPLLIKRSFFFAGFFLFLLTWLISSRLLLHIRFEGNYSLSEDVLREFLTERDVREGMRKKDLDLEELEKELREAFDIITWAGGRIDGTVLILSVKENETYHASEEETLVPGGETAGSSLYATADGTIRSILIRSGVSSFKAGDMIRAGDLVLDGMVPVYAEDQTVTGYQIYDADGDILIETELPVMLTMDQIYTKKEYTGRSIRSFRICLDDKEYPVTGGRIPYTCYDRILSDRFSFDLFGKRISLAIREYREYVEVEHAYDEEEAAALLTEQFEKNNLLLEEKGVQIISKDVTIGIIMDKWALQGTMRVYMPALERRPILLPEESDDQTKQ